MKCQGKFKFKEIRKRDGGEFTNAKGEVIKYDPSYEIRVDEQTEERIYERRFKTPIDSPLVSTLEKFKPYDDLILEFDVTIFGTNVRLIPIAVKQ